MTYIALMFLSLPCYKIEWYTWKGSIRFLTLIIYFLLCLYSTSFFIYYLKSKRNKFIACCFEYWNRQWSKSKLGRITNLEYFALLLFLYSLTLLKCIFLVLHREEIAIHQKKCFYLLSNEKRVHPRYAIWKVLLNLRCPRANRCNIE